MSATVHSFPALNAPGASRGWVLVIIAALHVGFFYLLTSGLATPVIEMLAPPMKVTFEEVSIERLPERSKPPVGEVTLSVPVPTPPMPTPIPDWSEPVPVPPPTTTAPAFDPAARGVPRQPVVVVIEPAIPARGLSEPVYPAAEIRQGHTGTVLLSIYVLEDGHVGDVRIDESSGYARLDDAAARQARRWRLTPGTLDGAPAAMWKRIPVTFRLNE